MEQLYVIQIDRHKQYPNSTRAYPQQYVLHIGGRGNGAQGGLYTKKQLNRILGKYPEGVAKVIPVYFEADVQAAIEDARSRDAAARANAAKEWGSYDG